MLVMYVYILPSVLHFLCMVPSLLVLVHHFCIIIAFILYHKFTTPSFLILVHSPSDCGTFIINNMLLFIDTLYCWYLYLCIVYVCINSTSTICTALSNIGLLPACVCTYIFT